MMRTRSASQSYSSMWKADAGELVSLDLEVLPLWLPVSGPAAVARVRR